MTRYEKPRTLERALELASAGSLRVLAGGTDFYPAQGAKPLRDDVLDINGLDELRGVAAAVEPWHLAALTPIDDVRGDAGYRRVAALELVGRALSAACAAQRAGRVAA